MDTNLKSTEPKGAESRGRDMFKGAVSWLSFMILLCTLTAGLLSLLFVALDPTVAAGLGEAIVNLTYGEYPQWLPVMACSLVLLAASILVLVFAFRRDRRAFEDMLAAWLAKIWVEFKLLFILLVLLFTMTIDMYTNFTYGWFTVIAAVVFLYFLCLDIGKNRRFFRHNIVRSLLRALNDYRDLTSFEQRSIRRLFSTLAVIVGVLGISAVLFIALWRAEMDARAAPIRDLFLLAVVSFALAGVIGSVFWYTLALKRDLRDWNVLMGQIREMYSGNLNAVNHIAPNSNLYDCAMQLDADGQHKPEFIAPMLEALEEGNDIVIGSRFLTVKKPKTLRMLGSYIISWSIRLTTGRAICDPTSGMRMFNRRLMQEFAQNLNYGPEPDTISYLIKNGAKVKEVQVEMGERTAGQSYLTFWRSVQYMVKMSISILLIQWFRKRDTATPYPERSL